MQADEKELLEYLRVFVMIWQKIDFIWGMFITSYIPLFGFIHFYQGKIDPSFAVMFVFAILAFTLINGSALRSHYLIANTMSQEFRRLNRSFPDVNRALVRTAHDNKPMMVLVTHGCAFAAFVYMMGARVGLGFCEVDGQAGWRCLLALIGS